jgi:hypothetical protein
MVKFEQDLTILNMLWIHHSRQIALLSKSKKYFFAFAGPLKLIELESGLIVLAGSQ